MTHLLLASGKHFRSEFHWISWDKVGVGQITSLLSFFIHFLHLRLNYEHEVAVVCVDKIDSVGVLKVVAVVK